MTVHKKIPSKRRDTDQNEMKSLSCVDRMCLRSLAIEDARSDTVAAVCRLLRLCSGLIALLADSGVKALFP